MTAIATPDASVFRRELLPPAPDQETARALRRLSRGEAEPAWLPQGLDPTSTRCVRSITRSSQR
jgi:hypothetical protein